MSITLKNKDKGIKRKNMKAGTSFLKAYDNLYMLKIVTSYNETLHVESRGTKRNLNKENSTSL